MVSIVLLIFFRLVLPSQTACLLGLKCLTSCETAVIMLWNKCDKSRRVGMFYVTVTRTGIWNLTPVCCFDRNSTVELSRVEVPPNMTSWPHFHNGVAAGLRIANFSQVSNTWGESSWRVHRVLWVWGDIFLSNTRPQPNDKELYPIDQTPSCIRVPKQPKIIVH